jgi:hypothetical protein
MHGTLKAETAKPPRSSFRAQQRAFDLFREEFNLVRPHEALNMNTPADHYEPSSRQLPAVLPEPTYPSHFHELVAYPNGVISFKQTQWYISIALAGELVGVEEVDDDRFKAYFGPLELGLLDLRTMKNRASRSFGILIRSDGHQQARRRRPRRR